MTQKPVISMIAAIGSGKRGKNRALGKDGDLLYRITDDLKRFRNKTSGHPVIMGRKTWESLPEHVRPMPGRTNIVITRNPTYAAPGAKVVMTLDGALAAAKEAHGADEIFIIGGGEIYALALPFADRLYLTLVDDDKEGDAFFPAYEDKFTKEIFREERISPEGVQYVWTDLERL